MKTILITLAFLSFVFSQGFAAEDYIWPSYTPQELPEQYKNDKAVYLMYVQTYNFGLYGESFYNNFQRIYINKKEAIDVYANREMEITTEGRIVFLKGRVIKKNGDIIELDDEKIIISNIKGGKKISEDLYREAKMIYPDVQEGDILDLVYDIDFDGYVYSETMFLARELPVLYSRISIVNNSILDLSAFPLNGIPEVKYVKTNAGPTFQTEQNNVAAIPDGYFNAISPIMPKLIFNLWSPDEQLTYDVVYSSEYNYQYHDYHILKTFTEDLISNEIVTRDELTANEFLTFLKVQRHLLDLVSFDKDIKLVKQEKIRSKYLEQNVNSKVYRCLLENYMIEQGIEYEKCWTSSLWSGKFDAKVVAFDQLDASFFIIKDNAGNDHFLFMPTSKKNYQIDEIPYKHEGNSGIAMRGKEGVLKNITQINLPEGTEKETQQTSNFQLTINSSAPHLANGHRQDKFTGQYSPYVRSEQESSVWDELSIAPVVLKPNKINLAYPYETEFRQSIKDSAIVSELDGSLKMLDLSGFLPNNLFYEEENKESYAGYNLLPFKKKQQFRFFIQSDNPIKIEEKAEKTALSNGVGSCSYGYSQMGDNSIKIICEITLSKRILESETDNQDFTDLINFYHNMKSKKWVISM